ncbi:Adenylosuccinate synthetase [Chthonomonas calidirosea]|uniref:adenylosuccinate synthase n=1 Tax=Chthonomonas calidirosea TaxID=454171 RepID=UPI0006DD4692|nr:adenylosuccinate synthase [Chthonomonas calidirosea]CEK12530.1 Adenylosuccinate synthetase [Chthonomonas calidirosea]
MNNLVIVGAQWGDEAKGKLIDYLAQEARMVVRYGGGNNAGHSVKVGDEEYRFHLIPAGILHPHLQCVIAAGTVIDPAILAEEIAHLKQRGVELHNLYLSAAAHVILPYHRLLDELEESRRGEAKIGTTGRGIGPAYADKAARIGIRLCDFIHPNRFRERLADVLALKNAILTSVYQHPPLNADTLFEEYAVYAEQIKPYVCDTTPLIHAAAVQGGVLFEGAQGSLLDIDLGTYPYVTSSHPIAGGACLGTGVGPTLIHGVIGVAKAYTTRVGAGLFPTELHDATGQYIREKGHEYGTTTGRPRRCGWLDVPVLRYSAQINGLTCLALGHLDVLSGLDEVKICYAYADGHGRPLELPSVDIFMENTVTPLYETLPGWHEDIACVRDVKDLPSTVLRYIQRVEELTRLPIAMLSVGPERSQTIALKPELLHAHRA